MPETLPQKRRAVWALSLIAAGIAGLIASFLSALDAFSLLSENVMVPLLWGVPTGALGVAPATALVVAGAAMLALRESPKASPSGSTARTSAPAAVIVLLLGAIGWTAAFVLTADKVVTLLEPDAQLGCNVSLLVQCGANLESWQGSVFGFPNPLIGLMGWSAVIVVAALPLLRIRLRAWFWVAFNLGVAGALAFVVWLISQSIYVLGTLCPWCMITWAVTIPLFWMSTLGNAHHGHYGEPVQATVGAAYAWTPLITIASYLVVALIAQLRLDLLFYL